MSRSFWTPQEDALLREFYPNWPTAWLVDHFGRTERAIYARAALLGLTKSPEYLDSPYAGRVQAKDTRGKSTRFQKGGVPHNKGMRRPGWAPGRMASTQFKRGRDPREARNYRPIGSTRILHGNLVRKVTDDQSVYPARRWVPVHRLVWEAENGPVPHDHLVVFKQGMHTADESLITLDRLELITRAENMRRNSYLTRYPKEVADVIRLRGALNRKINLRSKKHEQQHQ